MFQTVYLTIQGYLNNRYQLGFPIEEVWKAFTESLATDFAHVDTEVSTACQQALKAQQFALFSDYLAAKLVQLPHLLFAAAQEWTYHGLVLGIISGMGIRVAAEQATDAGRVDLVLEIPTTFYVVELKLDSSAEAALDQTHEKGYYKGFLWQGKEVALIGMSLASVVRNIADWKGELLDETGRLIRHWVPNQPARKIGLG